MRERERERERERVKEKESERERERERDVYSGGERGIWRRVEPGCQCPWMSMSLRERERDVDRVERVKRRVEQSGVY